MSAPALATPVALVVFNRPDLTRTTLAALREVAPADLYVIADGPRPWQAEDPAKCAATRAVLDEVDWPCQVHRLFREHNLGCEGSIELGLDWVFSQVERAIVVEDDCVPDPTFFAYAEELLERYADDEQVMMIAGNALEVPQKLFRGDSYAFTSFSSVWGWATWARAWQRHRGLFPRGHEGTEDVPGTKPPERAVRRLPDGVLATAAGRRYFQTVADTTDGGAYSWDSHWWVSLLMLRARAITPSVNLVQNIGFGPEATYTTSGKIGPPAGALPFPLRHPATTDRNQAVQRELELMLIRASGPLAQLMKRLLGRGRLWAALRVVATSRAVMTLARGSAAVRARLGRSGA